MSESSIHFEEDDSDIHEFRIKQRPTTEPKLGEVATQEAINDFFKNNFEEPES